MIEHQNIFGDRGAGERAFGRRRGERRLQGADRREVEIGIAPLHQFHRLEGVRFERLDQFGLERRTAAAGAERAVAGGAAGTAGDLGEFGGAELAKLIAVEFAVGGKSDVIDVEIETHADGVGRHQVVDLTGLIELDLSIARARRQRAEHDRGAAALAADQFGDGVNFFGRKRDDGGTARQPRQFFLAGEGELRQPRAADDAGAGQQPLDDRLHGGGAEHQRFLAAAPVQHAIGEDMTALEVGGELDLVDGEESNIEIARHRLDGGDPEARIGRLDLLFAGDQRHRLGADPLDRPVIDFARQQPQRQADQAGRMRQHPLDREMRLAGIGRAQHGGDAGTTGTQITVGGRRERNRHQRPGIDAASTPFCITTLRWKALCLTCGTSLERIAAESATPSVFNFVHRDIWAHTAVLNTRSGGIRAIRSVAPTPKLLTGRKIMIPHRVKGRHPVDKRGNLERD